MYDDDEMTRRFIYDDPVINDETGVVCLRVALYGENHNKVVTSIRLNINKDMLETIMNDAMDKQDGYQFFDHQKQLRWNNK